MSNSRLTQGRGLQVVTDLAGLELVEGPLSSMRWPVPTGPRLSEEHFLPRRFSFGVVPGSEPVYSLIWERGSSGASREVTPRKDLVLRFANLAAARPAAFRRFAQAWGPLHLCGHGLPFTHMPFELLGDVPDMPRCPPRDLDVDGEPITLWRRFANEAASIIRITALLKEGTPAPGTLWEPMRHLQRDEPLEASIEWTETYAGRSAPPSPRHLVESQESGLEYWINWWLRVAGIGPALTWGKGLELVGWGSLFGALAFQLASLAHSTGNVAWCAVCGRLFTTSRKRQSGRLTYCNRIDCRERGRRRLSARKRNAERRSEATQQ